MKRANPNKPRASKAPKSAANGVSALNKAEIAAADSVAPGTTPLSLEVGPPDFYAADPVKLGQHEFIASAANGQGVQVPEAAPQRERPTLAVPQQDASRTPLFPAAIATHLVKGAIADAAKPPKEKRGRRYKTLESARRGVASVINRMEAGTLDRSLGAVLVQAFHELQTIISTMEASAVEARAAELEQQAESATERDGEDVGHA